MAFTQNGGTQSLSIDASSSGCNWEITDIPAWINIGTTSGTDDATISVIVEPNVGLYREATITVAGQDFIISQDAGCALPNIVSFTSSPSRIQSGENSVLSWSITDADSAQINQEIGSVNPASGSITLSPDRSSTYVLTATNSCDSITASTQVSVIRTDLGYLPSIFYLLF